MGIHTYGWCRVEGAHVPDLGATYGTLSNINSSMLVFYGQPEIQIFHPSDTLNGVIYKVVTVNELCGYTTINEIDEHLYDVMNAISLYDKTIDTTTGSQYYYEPFTISESCFILYASSIDSTYSNYSFLLVDALATPKIIAVTAEYGGSSIPVGTVFSKTDIIAHAIYEDLQDSLITPGAFTVEPANCVIINEGSNVITVKYITPDERLLVTTCIVTGIKNVSFITASYDASGPMLSDGQAVQKKYVTVIAHYTDGTSAVVTNYTMSNGSVVTTTNNGILSVYYKGKTTNFSVPMYTVESARLVAYYNGPDVEVGAEWPKEEAVIKIYYNGKSRGNGYSLNVDPNACEFSTDVINEPGLNQISVNYTSRLMGDVSTVMTITGVKSGVSLSFITADYSGPEIIQGKMFSLERVTVKCHYTDGTVQVTRNYTINSNVVSNIGVNEFTITVSENNVTRTCTIGIIGLEPDSTTESSYTPTLIDLNYPEATAINHRFRGPVEANKMRKFARYMYNNITKANTLFQEIEKAYNSMVDDIAGNGYAKYNSLNSCRYIDESCDKWAHDDRFKTGHYVRG
jgi:hypothetical protein